MGVYVLINCLQVSVPDYIEGGTGENHIKPSPKSYLLFI